ncbi:hypothetical protein [Leeia sp.]|uniref:hypothetical protein n=1 Tax=Leeia sp. TaxID=2884678 RepID=UPI0035B3BC24
MTWVVASFVSIIEWGDAAQDSFPIIEDNHLFEVHSQTELDDKLAARVNAINTQGASGVYYDGKPATQRCLGVRKVKTICNAPPLDMDIDPPAHGTELSYTYLEASSKADAEHYADGEAVSLYRVDDATAY